MIFRQIRSDPTPSHTISLSIVELIRAIGNSGKRGTEHVDAIIFYGISFTIPPADHEARRVYISHDRIKMTLLKGDDGNIRRKEQAETAAFILKYAGRRIGQAWIMPKFQI